MLLGHFIIYGHKPKMVSSGKVWVKMPTPWKLKPNKRAEKEAKKAEKVLSEMLQKEAGTSSAGQNVDDDP